MTTTAITNLYRLHDERLLELLQEEAKVRSHLDTIAERFQMGTDDPDSHAVRKSADKARAVLAPQPLVEILRG